MNIDVNSSGSIVTPSRSYTLSPANTSIRTVDVSGVPARGHCLRLTLWTAFLLWLWLLVALTIGLPLWATWIVNPIACQPDDTFSPVSTGYNWWSQAGFFQITYGGGSLTFTQAKVIDITWNLLVGRLGQALMSGIFWRVLSNHMATKMETEAVAYSTFWMIYLHQETSIMAIYQILSDRKFYRALGSKITVSVIIASVSLILAFPTLASAMAGYTASTESFVTEKGTGNYIRYTEFQPIAYVIHNGDRVNLTRDYVLTVMICEPPGDPLIDHLSYRLKTGCVQRGQPGFEMCMLRAMVTEYLGLYGFPNPSMSCVEKKQPYETFWDHKRLEGPPLNISAYYFEDDIDDLTLVHQDCNTTLDAFRDKKNVHFTFSGQIYDLEYITLYGSCQPTTGRYRWGFSYIQLCLIVATLLVWTLGICLVWLQACWNLPSAKNGHIPNQWRSMLLLSERIVEGLKGMHIEQPSHLDNNQLDEIIKNGLQGGQISFEHILRCKNVGLWRGLWCWTRSHKYWVLFFSVSAIFTISMIPICVGLLDYDMRLPETLNGLRRGDNGVTGAIFIVAIFVSFCYSVYLLHLIVGRNTRARLR
ncbi:hypothetical protein QBC40DRAFT_172222 [Triangularia verruculosa]|uniref:Uncharacterized protein n=1 Tax=Triangularia verruculosa TaxID=2587418 RepID=A0AAN6XIG5_9PEZI|nr:hypothetical protein QBC40DRAFT_172222 [Triangularia verruculosa]